MGGGRKTAARRYPATNREAPERYVANWGCPVRPKRFVDDC